MRKPGQIGERSPPMTDKERRFWGYLAKIKEE